MEQRKRERLTSIAIHSVVLAALAGLLIFLCFKDSNGQYYDLLINKSLSKTLNGNWAKTAFAFIFSIIAEYPAYFILPIFAVMLFYSDDLLPAKWRIPFKILMAALSVGGWVILCCKSEVADMIQYTGFDGIKFYALMGALALCAAGLGLFLGRYIPKKTRYVLFKFAIFAITYLMISLVVSYGMKFIWHRMRFRDMLKENALANDGFSYFTPWFRPDTARIELSEDYKYTSFPSGHANAATHIFILCTLWKVLPKWHEKKWLGYMLYGGCSAFVVLTAVSRICDDAHFLSDVVMGSLISYTIYKVTEILFFRKGTNFKVAQDALSDLE